MVAVVLHQNLLNYSVLLFSEVPLYIQFLFPHTYPDDLIKLNYLMVYFYFLYCTIGFVNLYGVAADDFASRIRPGVRFRARFYGKASRKSRQRSGSGRRRYEQYQYLLLTLGSAAYNQNNRSGFIQIL